jgi:surface protein
VGEGWSTDGITDNFSGSEIFDGCISLVGGAGTTYDANHTDYTYAHIDGGPSNPGYLSDKNAPVVPDPEPYVVLDGTTMTFYYDTEMNSRQGMPIVAGGATVTWGNYAGGITNVVFTTSFADYLPISTASWFSGFKSLTTITGIENLKTDSVKSMRSMFQGCASLIHVDMSQFNTSKVEDYGNIFNGCSSLAAIQAGYAMIPAEEYARVDNPNLLLYVNEPSLVPQSVQNVVVRDFAKTIILTDEVGTSGNNNFYAPKSFTAEMISYTHEYRQQTVNGISRGWESIVLPFTVQTIVNERNGVIAPFGNSASELHFWLRQLISDGIVRATQIEANKAYIISMPNNEEEYPAKYNQNGRVTFSSENALVPATVVEGVEGKIASGEIVTLMPNFQKKYANENFYALNVGEERLYNGTSYPEGSVFERGYRAVRPFEAYTIHRSNGPAPRFVPIIEMDADATGIEDVRCKMSDGRDDQWYDLKGNKLQQKPTRKGVYILNGRKVVVE